MIDFQSDTALTQRMLDALDARAKAALHNIANQHTPGFKRYVVRFEELLDKQLDRGGKAENVQHEIDRDLSGRRDQNNVNLVEEVALLDKTKLLQEFVTRRAGGYFGKLNKAIFGR
jgi:flagellar basal body rod protein FlgB